MNASNRNSYWFSQFIQSNTAINLLCLPYDTIDDLHWKTDRQCQFNLAQTKNTKNVQRELKSKKNKSQETGGYGRETHKTERKTKTEGNNDKWKLEKNWNTEKKP